MKVSVKMHVDRDLDVRFEFSHVGIETEEDARLAGEEDAAMVWAYTTGYGQGNESR